MQSEEYEPLDNWNTHEEAQFFSRLVKQGQMTIDEVEDNIRMSGADVLFLRNTVLDVISEDVIERLRVRREQTWEAFQRLLP
jgi:hypothetical protein